MRIAIIGTGYVGLTSGTCLSELGNSVVCADIDESKIATLSRGEMPIYEPGLKELVQRNIKDGRLSFTVDLKKAITFADVIFVCVGTPPKADGDAELSYVENTARMVAEHIDRYKLVVEKSTVPVQTGRKVEETIRRFCRKGIEFDVASNPEFLREGTAIKDFMEPDRIVVGAESERAREIFRKLYAPLKAPILFTDINSAEIIKHASNSFLAAKISFINAVANICEKTGGNVEQVAEGMGFDKRIGRAFLNAGIGYGGSCFPKDVDAFVKIAEKNGYDFKLLREVQEVNKRQKAAFVKKVKDAVWNLKDKKIAVLGLAFKPNTDDMREAPSIYIISELQKEGAKIKAYDPEAMEKAKALFRNIEYCKDAYEAANDAEALLILTEWSEFMEIDFAKIGKLMKTPLVIDGRNIYGPSEMEKSGIRYISMGR